MTENYQAAEYAARYINSTQRHVFLTGKAGTGKTTFLRDIVTKTYKNTIVAAPTGIAAINAGGVTLHSLFQLPFGSFLPSNTALKAGDYQSQFHTPNSLMKAVRLNTHKRRMLQELELLIIDEVSMLRADILDAIDHILRVVRRRRSMPFGGVQLLLIGDMMQLPPVVRNNEWNYLRSFYKSVFFFDANVLTENPPVYLELEKIYRQTDIQFVALLNHIRDNCLTDEDMQLLDKYYKPNLSDEQKRGAVSLTTHNRQAEQINRKMLNALPGKSYHYKAEVSGDFNEFLYPVEFDMELKVGAQVMFIKNDYSGQQRYFNGKIGEIANLDADSISVKFPETGEVIEIEYYTWENKRYKLNKELGEIEEKEIGTYQHYPIKLAWAITVHKSQGLTFDKAIIDVSRAFAPGQVYVALSRLRSLNGLILTTSLPKHGLSIDQALSEFSKQQQKADTLADDIRIESFKYLKEYLLTCFDFREFVWTINDHIETYDKDENRSAKQKHKAWADDLLPKVKVQKETGDKFVLQIKKLTRSIDTSDSKQLAERVKAAVDYFTPLVKEISGAVQDQIKDVGKGRGVKKYATELKALDGVFLKRLRMLVRANILAEAYRDGVEPDVKFVKQSAELLSQEAEENHNQRKKSKQKTPKEKLEKQAKKPTMEVSFELYQELKDPEKIAEIRGFALSTIYGHLAQCVAKKMLPATDFISEDEIEMVVKAYKTVDSTKLTDIKAVLGDEFTFEKIRIAMAAFFSDNPDIKS
ncbi:MAG: helix-turn-helix domain-containing protein [Bacteroidota bacterium]|nr:helix-turn-helix domain-containing protein [Bacteroidota bacterium]